MFYGLMLAIAIIVLALALAGPVKDTIDSARNETTDEGGVGLNCTGADISDYDRGACLVADITIFHFIGAIIFIAGAVITARIIFGGTE